MAQHVESEEEGYDYMIVQPKDTLSEVYDIERYWEIVKRTLREVFNAENLVERADALKKKIDVSEPSDQVIFYHAEPIDVASDLVGRVGPDHVLTVGEKRA